MLGLVPAVESYFWIFNRYPIIPMGLLNKKKKLVEMQNMPLLQADVPMEGSVPLCLAVPAEPGLFRAPWS